MNELAALAAGRPAEFHGLAGCTLAEADAALGGGGTPGPLLSGVFGGEPTQFRRYPAAGSPVLAGAPGGVTCWVLGEAVVGIEIHGLIAEEGALAALGSPDLVLESGAGPTWSQQVWTSRGLVLHRRGDEVRLAFGLAPIDPPGWASDPLSWWREERRRD